MANNRIYIRCKVCGKELFIGKRLGFGYFWTNYGKFNNKMFENMSGWEKQDDRPLEDRLNEFYSEHEWCCGEELDCFEISYEIPPVEMNKDD